MYWNAEHLAVLEGALDDAIAGRPAALLITGEPGTGKSSLLDEIVRRATSFTVHRTDNVPTSVPTAYGTLAALGVDIVGEATETVLAGQRLRAMIDELSESGPVLLVVDDAQWSDPESVEVLVAAMARAEAEKLLLVLALRPLTSTQHPTLQHWQTHSPLVRAVTLTGLTESAAAAMLRELNPQLSTATVQELWRHTGGNPLFLRTLAAEHSAGAFARMRVLPAPSAYAASIEARVSTLSSDAQRLARAVAVLGPGATDVRDAATVADLDPVDALAAGDELAAAGVLSTTGEQVRFTHSLARAAIYQHTPLADRHRLHERAASVVLTVAAQLEHRVASTGGYDDELAGELEEQAARLRQRRDFRSAARYLRFASAASSDRGERERRWLESLYETAMAMDRAGVRAELDQLNEADDARRRDLVLGVLAAWERRPFDAVRLLAPWSGAGPADTVQYRIEAMTAWARLHSDQPESEIRQALGRADALPVADSTTERLAVVVRGQLALRHRDSRPPATPFASLADDPRVVSLTASSALTARGSFRSNDGLFALALADLLEATDRMQRGLIEFSSGTYHAVLARTQWFLGDWARSRVSARVAADFDDGFPHPIVVGVLPLLAVGTGDFERADELIAQARAVLTRVPWREAVDHLAVTEVIRAHAAGGDGELFARLEQPVKEVLDGASSRSSTWLVHAALAALWAGQLTTVRQLADRVAAAPSGVTWSGGLAHWLRGLAAEATGDGRGAFAELSAATASDLSEIPLYRAHVHLDHARIAHLVKGDAAGKALLEPAENGYRSLGATPYLERVLAVRSQARPAAALVIDLSERERDVLTLVVAGLSYAQVARDLFISQSTVSFHLGNIYAKANVKSRHELGQLARATPALFGLSG